MEFENYAPKWLSKFFNTIGPLVGPAADVALVAVSKLFHGGAVRAQAIC